MKNAFALVNRTPPDVLSLVPEYWNHRERDRDTIKLTHVCRGWRMLFTSRPSLWNHLNCADVNKTRAYLERSKSSPLEITLNKNTEKGISYRDNALPLLGPHIGRVKSLAVTGVGEDILPIITTHFSCPVPLLERLSIVIHCPFAPVLNSTLFNGDLSSLRTLELDGVVTSLPWKNLPNLTSFALIRTPEDKISTTVLLDFFERTPLLRKVSVTCSMPKFSDAPPERVVSLPGLEEFVVGGPSIYSTLLNHLWIPPNALMMLLFDLTSDQIPIQDHHPKSLANFKHLSHITQVSVGLRGKSKLIQLYGPSGRHYIHARWVKYEGCPVAVNVRILQSVVLFDTSRVQRLGVTQYTASPQMKIEESPPYHVLYRMGNLRTLTLTECHNILFFNALNPDKTPGAVILCPWLTDLVLHIHLEKRFCLAELWETAKVRYFRGVGFRSITVVGTQQLVQPKDVFTLRQYVGRVEYKLEDEFPEWNVVVPEVREFE